VFDRSHFCGALTVVLAVRRSAFRAIVFLAASRDGSVYLWFVVPFKFVVYLFQQLHVALAVGYHLVHCVGAILQNDVLPQVVARFDFTAQPQKLTDVVESVRIEIELPACDFKRVDGIKFGSRLYAVE